MNRDLEKRSYMCEVRAENDNGESIIEGRPIVYGSRTLIRGFWGDEWEEEIVAGALNKTDLTDVRFLVNHDMNRIPLARSRRNNGNSTMQLFTDDEGMRIRVRLDTENNAEARALYSAVSRGDISGMSFCFSVAGEEWENLDGDMPLRRITEIASVVEVSAVTFPAYQSTEIHVRSGKDSLEKEQPSALEKARQQRAAALEKVEVEKIKLKISILGGN